jgi:predicted MFS family arabinose efflux permease
MRRDGNTLALYGSLGCLGYLFAGLGPALPHLRDELGLSRTAVALYPSALALGLLVVGLAGHLVLPRLGRRAVPAATTVMSGGALVFGLGHDRFTCGAGALLLGLGAAALVYAVPLALRAAHGDQATAAVGEANGVSSAGGLLAAPLVGAALGLGLGWRPGYLAVPLLAAAVLIMATLRVPPKGVEPAERRPGSRTPRAFVARWLDIVLAVSAEFCFALWAADLLQSQRGLEAGAASAVAGLFVLGMVAGRAVASPVTRLVPSPPVVVAGSALVATSGASVLWLVADPVAAGAGLLVAGLGVALLYPVSLVRALAAWPEEPDRAAARCTFASGLAIGLAPLVLGALADVVGLGTAVLLPAVLLAWLAVRAIASARAARAAVV